MLRIWLLDCGTCTAPGLLMEPAEIWPLWKVKLYLLEKKALLADPNQQASLRPGLGKEPYILVLTACKQEIDNFGISRLLPKCSVPEMHMIFWFLFYSVREEGIVEVVKWDSYLEKMRIVLLESTVQDSETARTKKSFLCLNLHSYLQESKTAATEWNGNILLYLMYPEGKQSELWVAQNAILQIRTYFSVKDSGGGHITSVWSFSICGAW